MFLKPIREWSQKRKLREMLSDPRSARGYRSTGQLEKGIGADRTTTERLLVSIGARKAETTEEWTLSPLEEGLTVRREARTSRLHRQAR